MLAAVSDLAAFFAITCSLRGVGRLWNQRGASERKSAMFRQLVVDASLPVSAREQKRESIALMVD